jgi:hypothetical protein
MSTEQDQARSLAERIARKVSADNSRSSEHAQWNASPSAEIAAVRASISALQQKLAQLESSGSAVAPSSSSPSFARTPFVHSPWLAGVNAVASHPTEERFGVDEAVINELVDYFQSEKTCSIDPSGKPCDHCAMCSSRGF